MPRSTAEQRATYWHECWKVQRDAVDDLVELLGEIAAVCDYAGRCEGRVLSAEGRKQAGLFAQRITAAVNRLSGSTRRQRKPKSA